MMVDLALVIAIVSGCHCVCAGDDDLAPIPDPISTPRIILPMTPVLVDPSPEPDPDPIAEPVVVSTIRADEWYVIEARVQVTVRQFPEGLIEVDANTQDAGQSIKLRGKFSDGSGKIETRIYRSPFVYLITAVKPGKLAVDLVTVNEAHEAEFLRQELTVEGIGPRPPPDPEPGPTPPPGPVVPGKLQIVIIEDPGLTTAAQTAILDGQALRDYVKTHCSFTGNTADIRKLSLRQDVSAEPEWIKKAFAIPRSSMPFLVVSNGVAGTAGPLPPTTEETLALLKKYGGD